MMTPNGRYLYQNDLDRNDRFFPTSLQLADFSADAATGAPPRSGEHPDADHPLSLFYFFHGADGY